jgi:hypothetical protein
MVGTVTIDPGKRTASRLMIAVAALCGVAFAGSIMLWIHYGTAAFIEMIAAGIAACF